MLHLHLRFPEPKNEQIFRVKINTPLSFQTWPKTKKRKRFRVGKITSTKKREKGKDRKAKARPEQERNENYRKKE